MSAPAFTPGPWAVCADSGMVYAPNGIGDDPDVATVYAGGYSRDDAENHRREEANARLIAAAPELYEALEQLHSETLLFLKREGKVPGVTGPGRSLYDKVERALAKGRGDAK